MSDFNEQELWHNITVCQLQMIQHDKGVTDALFILCRYMNSHQLEYHSSPSGSDWFKLHMIRLDQPTMIWVNVDSDKVSVTFDLYVSNPIHKESMSLIKTKFYRDLIPHFMTSQHEIWGTLGQQLRQAKGCWQQPAPDQSIVKPIDMNLVWTGYSDSHNFYDDYTTGIPVGQHVGAFGFKRKFHIHEGVDIYAPKGTKVHAMLPGTVEAVKPFTGTQAGSDWWNDTQAVFVQTSVGMIVYGEIESDLKPGMQVDAGQVLGQIIPVLKKDKGRPTAMLHLELRTDGCTETINWGLDEPQPANLLDPTTLLLRLLDYNTK